MVMHVDDIMSNMTNLTSNATRPSSHEGTTAFFLALERAGHSGLLMDALLITFLLAVMVSCFCWKPRLTSAIAAAWLAWFAFRFAEGQAAWSEVIDHAQHARKATETAVSSVALMLASWSVLVAPALFDLYRLLEPLARSISHGAVQLWNVLSWRERGIAGLSCLAVASSVVATRALWRHQDTVKQVLFQLSFAVCGPLIWWLISRLPHTYGILVVGAAMSLVPCLASLLAILKLQQEREAPRKEAELEPTRSAWFAALDAIDAPLQESISEDLQAKMRMWLSYWALWPFFHVTYSLANSLDRVHEEDRAMIDGLFVALILWAQFWEASRIAPYGFAICAVCFQSLSQRAGRVADVAGSRAVGHAASLYTVMSERFGSNSAMLYAAVGLSVLVLVAVLLRIVELTEALVTIAFLFCVAFDSARCVARCSVDVYTSRLAFWVITMAWLRVRELPVVGAAVHLWTPMVLIAALIAGETILSNAAHFVSFMLSGKSDKMSQDTQSASDKQETKYVEVSNQENANDGQTLQRAPLKQPDAV
jgi:hypothetical protein